jgi:hypothetical protein
MYALPSYPSGHWQVNPWFCGMHKASSPQESSWHGLMQIRLSLSQNLSGGQSSLY